MLSEEELIERVLQRTAAIAASSPNTEPAKPASEIRPRRPMAKTQESPRKPCQMKAVEQTSERETGRAEVKVMPGLCAKARITTSFGALPVEALRERDEVRTSRGTFLRVAKVDKMHLDADFLYRYQHARPILIKAGALGRGMPLADVMVSPEQLVSTSKMPQTSSCKAAKSLLALPGVMQMTSELVTYFNFHCAQEVMVQVEGLWIMTRP